MSPIKHAPPWLVAITGMLLGAAIFAAGMWIGATLMR